MHERDRPDDPGALAEVRLDPKIPADRFKPIPHVRQAGAEGRSGTIKPRTVIRDLEYERVLLLVEPDRCSGALTRMLTRVLERLKAAEIDGRLDLGVVASARFRP